MSYCFHSQFESLHKIGFKIYITEKLSEIEKGRVVLLLFREVGTYYSNCVCKILPFIGKQKARSHFAEINNFLVCFVSRPICQQKKFQSFAYSVILENRH